MSKAAKQSLLILAILLVASLSFCIYLYFGQQDVIKAKKKLELDLSKSRESEKKSLLDYSALKDSVQKTEEERDRLKLQTSDLDAKLRSAQDQLTKLNAQFKEVTDDRDKWKSRIDAAREERDKLMAKIQELSTQQPASTQVANSGTAPKASEGATTATTTASTTPQENTASTPAPAANTDDYWASILKEKAAIEVKLQDMQSELQKTSVDLVDLKQKNSDLQMEIDNLKAKNDELNRDIKFKGDLVNNLSLELARTKGDKKLMMDRISQLNDENAGLRDEMKTMVAAKSTLQKSIVQLSQDKDKLTKKLIETEGVIQNKIDQIWEIKDSLQQSFKPTKVESTADTQLKPIVVANGGEDKSDDQSSSKAPGIDGKIVSINEENNFVILDLGENSGIHVGDKLSVYRDAKYIARLSVIQVRKDISAADIKEQWTKVQAGDSVR